MGRPVPVPRDGSAKGLYGLGDAVVGDELGTVHRGHDPRSGLPVLVRLPWRALAGSGSLDSFEDQLQAAARLHHPNLVGVRSGGVEGELRYVVTEEVDGERLGGRLAAGEALDRSAAMALLRGLACGIDHAHSMGVTHGAIGSASVVLTRGGVPRLTDFAVGEPADAAEDVRAFAAMARALLSGAPDARGLSRPVAAVLARGAAADPGERWSSCRELAAALERRLAAPRRRRREATLCLVAVAALALVVSLVAPGGPAFRAPARSSGTPTARSSEPGQPLALRQSPSPTQAASTAAPPTSAAPAGTPGRAASPTPTATRPPIVAGSAPSISLGASRARPSQYVTVRGSGFDPRHPYVIDLMQNGKRWLVQWPASPREDGSFTDPIQVPEGAVPGGATVVACIYVADRGPTTTCAHRPLTISSG
jgi:eukaryotic-like serine/threonine-protein kinase